MAEIVVAALDVLILGKVVRWYKRRWRRPRLIIGNFDNFFATPPTGKVAEKCLKLIWRCLFLMQKGDAIIVARAVPAEFLRYVELVRGFRPTIYHIASVRMPLDLVGSIIEDVRLCETLRRNAKVHEWVIAPLISHPRIFDLAEKLGLTVDGTPEYSVRCDIIRKLNSKLVFADWCEGQGLQSAGIRCYSKDEVEHHAKRVLKSGRTVVIREDVSAGGLGNGCYASREELNEFLAKLPRGFRGMVGPYLDLEHHLSVMFEVRDFSTRIVTTCLRRLKGRTESVGGLCPSPEIPGLADAVKIAKRYASHLRSLGYRGVADIDFGLNATGSKIILFESNARLVLTSVPVTIVASIEERWQMKHGSAVIEYDEDPPRGERQLDLDDLLRLALLLQNDMSKNEDEPTEIVIVSPPDHESGWYSFAVIAMSYDSACRARMAFRSMIEDANADIPMHEAKGMI